MNREVAPGQDWRTAYPFVEGHAKAILDALPEGASLSSKALVDALYDPDGLVDEKVYSRLFKALRACALNGLKPYVTVGEEEKIGRFMGRRLTWHRVDTTPKSSTCAACGRVL